MSRSSRNFSGKPSSAPFGALVALAAVMLVGCSEKYLGMFFDVPPRKPGDELTEPEGEAAETAAGAALAQSSWLGIHPSDLESDRPPIESAATWEEALALLPADKKGVPNWSEALREGVIKPRAFDPKDRMSEFFRLDFFIKSDKPKFDTWFPHSSHLEWMGCDSCHPAVFKYMENEISMKSIRSGEHCGACHGSVAFPAKDCKRCHTQM